MLAYRGLTGDVVVRKGASRVREEVWEIQRFVRSDLKQIFVRRWELVGGINEFLALGREV